MFIEPRQHSHWVEHYIDGWFCDHCGYYIDPSGYFESELPKECPKCKSIMDESMTEQTKYELHHQN